MTSVRIIPVSQEEPIEFIEPLKLTTSTTTTSSQVTSNNSNSNSNSNSNNSNNKSEASVREEFRETVTTTTSKPSSESNMKTSLMIGKFAGPQDTSSSTALETWKDKSLISKLREDFFNLKEGIDTDMGVVKRDDAFEVNFDVTGFQPKDLTVIIKDDLVTITGCHEEKSLDGSKQIQRKFERKYTLPPNVDSRKIKSLLSLDGKSLKFEAPYLPKETPVAITYEKKVTMKTVTTRQG